MTEGPLPKVADKALSLKSASVENVKIYLLISLSWICVQMQGILSSSCHMHIFPVFEVVSI